MQRAWLLRTIGWGAIAATLTACAPTENPTEGDAAGALRLSFEDVLAPAAFAREGPAMVDAAGGAAGLWAVVPELPRPERARVVNLASGAEATVALFAGATGPNGAIRISAAAGQALGVGTTPTRVRITALRREPRIAAP